MLKSCEKLLNAIWVLLIQVFYRLNLATLYANDSCLEKQQMPILLNDLIRDPTHDTTVPSQIKANMHGNHYTTEEVAKCDKLVLINRFLTLVWIFQQISSNSFFHLPQSQIFYYRPFLESFKFTHETIELLTQILFYKLFFHILQHSTAIRIMFVIHV